MNVFEFCIRRPVFASVISLLLVVIGWVGYQNLDLRFFPEIEVPVVSISVSYDGADPETVETAVTKVIEDEIAGVDGIKTITSSSSSSRSSISVTFNLDANFEQGASQIRDKVFGVQGDLPSDAETPAVTVGGTSSSPVLSIGFTSDNRTAAEIRDYVSRSVKPVLRQAAGVGSIATYGASSYAMRIWLDASKMAALKITASDVETALSNNNINFPAGSFREPERTYSIISKARLGSAEAFGNIVLKKRGDDLVRLNQVANVELGSRSLQDRPMRINGQSAVDLEVKPLKSANPIDVAKHVRQELAKIKKNLPTDIQVSVNYDQSEFLKASIKETRDSIFEAVALVILVVFLFLGSVRASTIPIITIPLCLVGTFGLMYALGFSINMLTLLAMVLAIGLVVDDAIVMLENIHRHLEMGESKFESAVKGCREIAGPIIAMTLTLVAVYAPLGLMSGYTSVIFKEFAFTLAGAVLISGLIALTLSPMMCSKVLEKHMTKLRVIMAFDHAFERMNVRYQKSLKTVLRYRTAVVGMVLVLGVVGAVIAKQLPSQFVPKEDSGIAVTNITPPTNASVDYIDTNVKKIEAIYADKKKYPEIKSYYSIIKSSSALSYFTLKPWNERSRSIQEVVDDIAVDFSDVVGLSVFPSIPDPVDYGVSGKDFSMSLVTPGDYEGLLAPMDDIVKKLDDYAGVTQVSSGLKYDSQQFALHINRDKASKVGVGVQDIAKTMKIMLSGSHITDFQQQGDTYAVVVQMRKKDLKTFDSIKKVFLQGDTDAISLDSLVELQSVTGQSSLVHYNRMRAANISAQLAPGYSIGDVINYVEEKILPEVLTSDVSYYFTGKAQQYQESGGETLKLFVLALIFIYLILSAQFESFIDPFIVLFTVPLCVVGALLSLKLTGGTLSIYSQVGMITLVGLISKHGILITQFINQLRASGIELQDAIIQGASIRLRPIMMTTSAMVLGSLPLALATGPGSIGRGEIGWVIVGGLVIGTFFSLFVVPVAYSYLGKFKTVVVHNHHG